MTPKENTSDLSVSLPLDAYSGAKYLHSPAGGGQLSRAVSPDSLQCSAHPKVPMTRVETCVLVSVVSLASPKSATWDHDQMGTSSYNFTPNRP
jgi:hypothetical protein